MDISSLLAVKDVTVIGLLVTFAVVVLGGLATGRWYTKGQMDDKIKECSDLSKALGESIAANKQCEKDYTTAQIAAARFEERANFQQWTRQGSQQ